MARTTDAAAKTPGTLGVTKLLLASAAIEMVTGIVVIVAPQFVGNVLFGVEFPAFASGVARLAGIALVSLATTCWPHKRTNASEAAAPIWGLLTYNGLAAIFFCYWRFAYHSEGPLLWPAVAVHAVFAALFLRAALHDIPSDVNDHPDW